MNRGLAGKYIVKRFGDEEVCAFMPFPLPPNPPLLVDADLREELDQALISLGRLDSAATLLPYPSLLVHVCQERSGALVADRRDQVLSFRPSPV